MTEVWPMEDQERQLEPLGEALELDASDVLDLLRELLGEAANDDASDCFEVGDDNAAAA